MPRKQHKYHYIYKTTNLINNKFYIGMHSTDNINDGYIGSGTRLWFSIRKYGRENFKIEYLEFFEDRKLLVEREEKLVNEDMIKDPMCMNLRVGGSGGFTKENSLKGTNAMLNKVWSDPDFIKRKKEVGSIRFKKLHEEGKIKFDNFKGKKHSNETIDKLKSHNRSNGEQNSQFGSCWIHNNKENKKIKKEEINSYMSKGWIKGRKMQM